jgi:hypothetical protein
MKITITIRESRQSGYCTVTREPGDPVFSGNVNAAGESRLLYHMKKQLNKEGWDFIKKRMHKDGHMVDDMQQYLRQRKPNKETKEEWCIYNNYFGIRGADEDLRRYKKTIFYMENLYKGG